MGKKQLHITNGDALTQVLIDLNIDGEIIVWHEMLCEGPTQEFIYSQDFLEKRKTFFDETYDIEIDENRIISELGKLDNANAYSEIVLWFEYDLFCHINMVAAISLLQQKKINLPIYLVCSGRIEGEKDLKGLAEISSKQLQKHYKNKTLLTKEDIDLATTVWGIYCGIDHNLLKPFIVKSSSFKYLSNCLKAHLERFPDSVTGLNILETNILKIIKEHDINSKNHLLGYALNYQGYYGFGDLQMSRIINKLDLFYTVEDNKIVLNRKGHEALLGKYNVSNEVNNNICYGGIERLNYQFSKTENKLIKSALNVY
ncbi:DUF1835 domain-containing protein [Tamlana sp. 62-3]|uniref:DUF1835 domain-containing protein n=1 Tax=Neotamlana sargassicola TaxID=2883125 RepID=A0A9X1I5W8_9FLAO|nr:DUF1835 domain-containing protein [Tamlana sargassicola]MCB4808440.1 DUF1835 domain-containing protein [Tamlana sargassicola]